MQIARILIFLILLSRAGPINGSNAVFVDYVSDCTTEQLKIEKALNVIRELYPDWYNCYKANVFDCTEMSAFIKWYLGICGIKSDYMCSYNEDTKEYHVFIKAKEGTIIEATNLVVNYKEADKVFECTLVNSEVDWWNTLPLIQNPAYLLK